MLRTRFYTFLQTKEQQENTGPSDPKFPLFPQKIEEIEIRAPSPWIVLKTLTNDDIRGKFEFPMEQGQIRAFILRGVSEDNIEQMNDNVYQINAFVKDLDTNSLLNVKLWKYPQEDCFAMHEDWIQKFVNRRRLVEGSVVCMYWSVETRMFCFRVRNQNRGNQSNS